MSKQKLKKRIVLDLFAHPLTLGLMLAGLTMLLAAWALERQTGSVVFGAIICLAGSMAVFLTRFFVFGKEIVNKASREIQAEASALHERSLNELERLLFEDDGAVAATMLHDLRALLNAFHMARTHEEAFSQISMEVTIGIEELFERCVRSLEQTHQLWLMSQAVATTKAREPILHGREKLIKEVQQSIDVFAKSLADVQRIITDERCASELSQIRSQLDQNLKSAMELHEQLMLADRDSTAMNNAAEAEIPVRSRNSQRRVHS